MSTYFNSREMDGKRSEDREAERQITYRAVIVSGYVCTSADSFVGERERTYRVVIVVGPGHNSIEQLLQVRRKLSRRPARSVTRARRMQQHQRANNQQTCGHLILVIEASQQWEEMCREREGTSQQKRSGE